MNAPIAALLIVLAPWSALASDLTCTIKHGVYKFPVEAELMNALERWPELHGKSFTVMRNTGHVKASGFRASGFLSNEGEDVRVLRNVHIPASPDNLDLPSLSNQHEFMSIAKNSSVKLLSIDVLDGQLSFKYYFSMMGLLLTGPCIGT